MAEAKKEYFSIKGMKVSNVRKIPGTEVITFSLLGNGLGLYNLRVVNTAGGLFIAAPQSKGKDGKYYGQYAVYLSEEDEDRVLAAVFKKLPAEKQENSDEL